MTMKSLSPSTSARADIAAQTAGAAATVKQVAVGFYLSAKGMNQLVLFLQKVIIIFNLIILVGPYVCEKFPSPQ